MIARWMVICAVVAAAIFYLVTREGEPAPEGENEELEATHAAEALRWYNDQRAYPGSIPVRWRETALAKLQLMRKQGRTTSSIGWNSVGPANVGGRVRSIAIDTVNHVLYCGSVSGGIWKSTNAGLSWSVLTDVAPNLVIGSIAIDPTNPSVLYAGTGEGYYNVDALRGIGVLKSTDAGATWAVLSNFIGATAPVVYVNKLLIRPDNHNILYAAVSSVDVGVWRSTDAGASWTKQSGAGGSQNAASLKFCTDLVMDPANPDVMYGAFGLFNSNGVWKTTNGGAAWSKLTTGFPLTSTKYTRISLAIARSNPQVLYACLADSNYYTHSIQKTTDGGASWTAVATPFDNSPLISGTHLGKQGWYNNVIAVDPTNENVVFTGGINVFRSTDGGANWTRVSDGYAGGIHVDQHAIVFDPTNHLTIYFGNDGGMFKTINGGTSFIDLNAGLVTAQFYSGAVHPTADIYYGGTQDNGTLRTSAAPAWAQVFSGDGGVTIVDPATPTTVYTEYVYLAIQKSIDNGLNFARSINGIPTSGPNASNGASDRCGFIAPFAMDPSNPNVLVAGTYRVFRTTNGGDLWAAISPDLTGEGASGVGSPGSVITALAVAKTSTAIIYAGTSGFDSSSRVLMTTNTGSTWTNITKAPLPRRYVKAVAVDPTNANRAVVTFSGYDVNTPTTPGHVFRTTNRGTTWLNSSGNLPDIPVNCALIDTANFDHLLIGTDLGVFETADGGTTWTQQSGGLANVSVVDLDMRRDGIVFAATHGRGMFRSTAPFGAPSSSGLSIVVHQNPALTQFVDFFVTASESLASPPSMTLSGGASSTQIIPIAPHTYRVYKGNYAFTSSGTIVLTATAQDSTGANIATTRIFQATLLKRNEGGTVQSPRGDALLRVAASRLTEDTYFTIVPESSGDPSLLGTPYTFGPAADFGGVTISFRYDAGLDERLLSVMRKTESGWQPLASTVDPARHEVFAQVGSLGTYALGLSESAHSTLVPETFTLGQNFPNPFNPSTTIRFALPARGAVRLAVYDLNGREVATLLDEERGAGEHDVAWDGRTGAGAPVASGIYFYRLSVRSEGGERFQATGKMMLLK